MHMKQGLFLNLERAVLGSLATQLVLKIPTPHWHYRQAYTHPIFTKVLGMPTLVLRPLLSDISSQINVVVVFIIFLCARLFCLHVHIWHLACLVLSQKPEGIICPRTGVSDNCKTLCMYWESNPNPKEQPMFLIPQPPLQAQSHGSLIKKS